MFVQCQRLVSRIAAPNKLGIARSAACACRDLPAPRSPLPISGGLRADSTARHPPMARRPTRPCRRFPKSRFQLCSKARRTTARIPRDSGFQRPCPTPAGPIRPRLEAWRPIAAPPNPDRPAARRTRLGCRSSPPARDPKQRSGTTPHGRRR